MIDRPRKSRATRSKIDITNRIESLLLATDVAANVAAASADETWQAVDAHGVTAAHHTVDTCIHAYGTRCHRIALLYRSDHDGLMCGEEVMAERVESRQSAGAGAASPRIFCCATAEHLLELTEQLLQYLVVLPGELADLKSRIATAPVPLRRGARNE